MQRPIMHLDKEALEALEAYPWNGNVRELENIIQGKKGSMKLCVSPAV